MPEQQDISGLGGNNSTFPPPPGPGGNASGVPSSPPSVLGINDLQQTIDRLNTAVDKLTKLYAKAAGNGINNGGLANGGGNGGFGSSPGGLFGTGSRYGLRHLGLEGIETLGLSLPQLRGPAGARYGSSLRGMLPGSGGQGGFMGTSGTFSGQPIGTPGGPVPPQNGGGGGGFASPGNGGYAPRPGNGGYGTTSSGGSGVSGLGWIASGALSVMSGLAGFGKASLPTQLAMSQMQQQGTLLAPSTVSNFGVYGDQMRRAAYGSHNANPNNFAMNAQDASAGFGTLQQMAGSGLPGSNSYGRFGYGAAASFAGANPGMSYAQAAQLGQSMMTPGMSLRMNQLGYGVSPLNMGGGANSFGGVMGGMMQRWFGQGSVAPQNLAASLRPGVGVGWANLTSLGYSPDQISGMTSTMEAYNQVSYRGKMSSQQVQNLFQQAQSGNKQATSTLAKYGVTQSDLSKIKQYGAQGTMNQSDIFNSFTTGLNGTIDVLTRFKQILNNIVNLPGINQLVGGGGGVLGTVGSFASDFKNIGEGAFGLGAMGYGAYKLLSKNSGGAGGLLGMLGIMDPEVVAAIQAGKYLPSLFGSRNPSAGNPLGNLGQVRNTNGNWTTNTMNVTARVVNINGPGPGGGHPATGGGPNPSGGGGNQYWNWSRGGNWNPLNWVEQAGYGLGNLAKKALGFAHGGVLPGYAPGVDDQPAMLSKGEAVLNPKAARKVGYHNIDQLNKDNPVAGAQTRMIGGVLYAANGATILSDAKKYAGHKYVYGGPSNPQGGWDCSSFTSYVLGHDMGLPLPGGSWATTTGSGASHGDVASQFINTPGTHKVSHNAADIQAGDLLVWQTHVGFGVSPGVMFSAYDTAMGTLQTGKDLKNAAGPTGEQLTILRYGSGSPAGNKTPGAGSPGNNSTSSNGAGSIGGGGASYNATSEASNVTAALGGGSGGVRIGRGSVGASTGPGSTSNPGTGSSAPGNYPNKSGSGIPQNAQQIANFLASKGANKIAIAGILGNVMQESGGNPNAGSNPPGRGLIQILGDPGGTVAQDLVRTWNYIQANGGIGPINAAKSATDAATIFSQAYERPSIPMLSNRISFANAAYAAGYSAGGTTPRDGAYIVGERGPEVAQLPAGTKITDAKRTSLIGAQGVAQVPWSAPTHGRLTSRSGVNVTLEFASGSIVIQQGGTAATNSRESTANSAREIFNKVAEMLRSEQVYAAIREGEKWG